MFNKLKRKVTIFVAAMMFASGGMMAIPAYAADFVIIMSDAYGGVSSISHKKLKNLYLRNDKEFNGVSAKPVNLAEGDALRNAFLQEVLGMNEDQLKSYWLQASLDGKGKPPKSLSSENSVIKYVSKKKGAIGYVSAAAASDAGLTSVAVE